MAPPIPAGLLDAANVDSESSDLVAELRSERAKVLGNRSACLMAMRLPREVHARYLHERHGTREGRDTREVRLAVETACEADHRGLQEEGVTHAG